MTVIVCQQLAPRIADLPANPERSVRAVTEAVDAGADVVVLPELVTSGYVCDSTDEAAAVAITPLAPPLIVILPPGSLKKLLAASASTSSTN